MNGPLACSQSKDHTEAVGWAIHNTAFRREAGWVLFFFAGLGTLESHSTSTHRGSSGACPSRCALPQAMLLTERSPHPSPRPLGPSHTPSRAAQSHLPQALCSLLYFFLGSARPSFLRQILFPQSSSSKYAPNLNTHPTSTATTLGQPLVTSHLIS